MYQRYTLHERARELCISSQRSPPTSKLRCFASSFFSPSRISYSVAREVFETTNANGTTTPLSAERLNLLYSISLFAVLPVSFPASHLLTRHSYATMFAGVLCNIAAAWLRYLSVVTSSYNIAVASSLMIGCAGGTIVTGVAYLPEKWFPLSTRTLATSIGVQANYSGWGISTLLIPYTATSQEALKTMLFIQALVVSGTLVAFVVLYRSPPKEMARRHTMMTENSVFVEGPFLAPFLAAMKTLFRNKAFVLQLVCYSILGGSSFAVTAVQAVLFEPIFSTTQGAWTNFIFVMSGVSAGIMLGSLSDRYADRIITTCAVTASLAMTCLSVVVEVSDEIDHDLLYGICLLAMSMSGISTLGFIGPALAKACRTTEVSHTWSGGAVEWWICVSGALLTLVSTEAVGFKVCAGMCWFATAGIVVLNIQQNKWSSSLRICSIRNDESLPILKRSVGV